MKALKLKQLCYRCVSCISMPKYAEFKNKGKKTCFMQTFIGKHCES